MNKFTKSLTALALMSSLLVVGCSNEEETKDDTKQEQDTETSTQSKDDTKKE
ncbi:hypothetical protein P6P90_02895 [Ectobacillus antri]|jgi:PBP1b-binding outer membrane lipoprotein LpoB|uniref:Lipoprotein n=1 Tax=Ectobacillus antri TaxID=2486280 RepID=A0ABT6H1U5_9BACI|nr:hypothetical protein [Ectobacillus antri]MDG4656272.1 hypothetical protein [Ectobacillus antri]MDG5752947.1 hypothetical protein [Ectobacillus antri]